MEGEKDKLNGVSSNIMMGQTIKAGTGFCSILLDEEKLIQEMENIQFTKEDFIDPLMAFFKMREKRY